MFACYPRRAERTTWACPESRLTERWRPDDDRPEVIWDVREWQPKVEPLRVILHEVLALQTEHDVIRKVVQG
jgi:hypothetical protein